MTVWCRITTLDLTRCEMKGQDKETFSVCCPFISQSLSQLECCDVCTTELCFFTNCTFSTAVSAGNKEIEDSHRGSGQYTSVCRCLLEQEPSEKKKNCLVRNEDLRKHK
jgi:hypothetical protein